MTEVYFDTAFDYGCRQVMGSILDSTRWLAEYDILNTTVHKRGRFALITSVFTSDAWEKFSLYEKSILFGELYQYD